MFYSDFDKVSLDTWRQEGLKQYARNHAQASLEDTGKCCCSNGWISTPFDTLEQCPACPTGVHPEELYSALDGFEAHVSELTKDRLCSCLKELSKETGLVPRLRKATWHWNGKAFREEGSSEDPKHGWGAWITKDGAIYDEVSVYDDELDALRGLASELYEFSYIKLHEARQASK